VDTVRQKKLMWRWSIVTAGIMTLFWTVWYWINGEVPTTTSIFLSINNEDHSKDIFWNLPFGISRWWDILIGPIWSVALIKLFTNKRVYNNNDISFTLVSALFIGIFFGLVLGLSPELGLGLTISLCYALLFGLGVGPVTSLVFGLVISLVFCLGICLVYFLNYGLLHGLVFGLGISLAIGLVFGLVYSLIYIIRHFKLTLSVVSSWLLAKN